METEKELLACHYPAGIMESAPEDTNLNVEALPLFFILILESLILHINPPIPSTS